MSSGYRKIAAAGIVPIGSSVGKTPNTLQGSRIGLVPVRPIAAYSDELLYRAVLSYSLNSLTIETMQTCPSKHTRHPSSQFLAWLWQVPQLIERCVVVEE